MLTLPFQGRIAGRTAHLVSAGGIAAVERILGVVVSCIDGIVGQVLITYQTVAGPDLPVGQKGLELETNKRLVDQTPRNAGGREESITIVLTKSGRAVPSAGEVQDITLFELIDGSGEV